MAPSTIDLINDTVAQLAERPAIFTASDVAAYADLAVHNPDIERALQEHYDSRSILALGLGSGNAIGKQRYLGKIPVERWWVESTLRWAKAGISSLTPLQLAREMALAFDTRRWDTAPASVLDIGRQWAMVTDGYKPGVFVFPWATVLIANPHGRKWFSQCINGFRQVRNVFGALPFDPDSSSLVSGFNEALSTLSNREANVIRGRLGLDSGQSVTLERLGNVYGVTRERIRQIEKKAWRKLEHPVRQQHIWSAFSADFIRSGGSLLIPEILITSLHKLLSEALGLRTASIPELGLTLMGTEDTIASYRKILLDVDTYLELAPEPPCFSKIEALQFLSQGDGDQLANAERAYRDKQIAQTRPRMLREALRLLCGAAHFEEIAYTCNLMFPEKQASTRNWHAALGWPASEAIGIVWIGRKGMYGLIEHGYTRPDTDMFDGVAQIVEDMFAKTQRPVPEDVVMIELGKYRRDLQRNSVVMALAFNDRLESVGRGEYIPKTSGWSATPDLEHPEYDIDAAFDAFSSPDDGKNL